MTLFTVLLGSNSFNFGSMFVVLDEFARRNKPGLHANEIMASLRQAYAEEMRDARVDVFSGMLGVTFFGIFLTPVFYYVISGFGKSKELPIDSARLPE